MADSDAQRRCRLVAIAPMPKNGTISGTPQYVMSYSCHTCAKRKVKCDKATPICSSCRKGKLECFYLEPLPRSRKRKLSDSDGILERLARYERILQRHGLLDESDASPAAAEAPSESRTGTLLANQGKSIYIDNQFWRNFGDHEMQGVLDDGAEEASNFTSDFITDQDPLTGAFLGSQQTLVQFHPNHTRAMTLWRMHTENIEPLCKILHIPSTAKMVERASQNPAHASRTDECLLFAIYHFAVFSITEEECMRQLRNSRASLMERYRFATQQALVNASFLKTTEMSVLQALVLFLLPCRYFYDSHTYWILTGVAVRIAQRMGLHRDGEALGLPPFEVQMRRRLFYQLAPLDGNASQMSGTGLSVMPGTWDTQQPLNINDDQIWPGMAESPKEQTGATEMIFCLSRTYIGNLMTKIAKSGKGSDSEQLKDYREADLAIDQAESEVEEKYIRYCDVVDPLHFLVICRARSGITAMRLNIRLPKFRNETATAEERRNMMQLGQKILDTDTAARAHAGLEKYRWQVRSFFLWGTWDSLVFIVTSLWRSCDMLSPSEIDAAWARVEGIYGNHDELLDSKRAFYVALGRLVLKAWDTHPPSSDTPEPAFIVSLRSLRRGNPHSRPSVRDIDTNPGDTNRNTISPQRLSDTGGANLSLESFSDNISFDLDNDLNLDGTDWSFWDQLMEKHPISG